MDYRIYPPICHVGYLRLYDMQKDAKKESIWWGWCVFMRHKFVYLGIRHKKNDENVNYVCTHIYTYSYVNIRRWSKIEGDAVRFSFPEAFYKAVILKERALELCAYHIAHDVNLFLNSKYRFGVIILVYNLVFKSDWLMGQIRSVQSYTQQKSVNWKDFDISLKFLNYLLTRFKMRKPRGSLLRNKVWI